MATTKRYPLSVEIGAKDRASATIRAFGRHTLTTMRATARGVSASLREIGASAGRSLRSIRQTQITADTLRGAGRSLRNVALLGAGAAGATAVAALSMAKSFVHTGDELAKFGKRVGFSVESLQGWRFAMGQAGISTEQFNQGLLTFGLNLGRARAGTGEMATALKKVSPSLLRQLKETSSNEEALRLYIAAMEAVPDEANRAALATAAFGGAGVHMALAAVQGSKSLKELRDQKVSDGVITTEQATKAEELSDRLDRLNNQYGAVKATVGAATAEALEPHLIALGEWVTANREVIGQNVAGAVTALSEAFRAIDWSSIAAGARAVYDVFAGLREVMSDVGEAIDLFPREVNAMPWADKGADIIDSVMREPQRRGNVNWQEALIRDAVQTGKIAPETGQAASRQLLGFGLSNIQGGGEGGKLGASAIHQKPVQGPSFLARAGAQLAAVPPAAKPSEVTIKVELPEGAKATTATNTTPPNIKVKTGARSVGSTP